MGSKRISDFNNNENPSGGNFFPIVVNNITMRQSLSGLSSFFSNNIVSNNNIIFSGGSVTGSTNFLNGLTSNVFSATTYMGLPIDVRITGGTHNNGITIFTNSTGGTITISGYSTGGYSSDIYVTGGTYSNGVATFINNSGVTFNVSGFFTGSTQGLDAVNFTGGTYSNGTTTLTNSTGGTISISGYSQGGSATFSGGTVVGTTTFTNGLSSNSISATTYQNLPISTNIYVTGGTYSNGVATFINNSGTTFNVTGFSTGGTGTQGLQGISGATGAQGLSGATGAAGLNATNFTGITIDNSTYNLTLTNSTGGTISTNLGILASDIKVTGGTYNINSGIVTFVNSTGGTFNVNGFTSGQTDTYTTGGTYNNGTTTFTKSNGQTYTVNGFNTTTPFTGGFVSGLTTNSISATTYYNLPISTNTYVTGGTYNNGTAIFTNNSGGTFSVSGIFTGETSLSIKTKYELNTNTNAYTNSEKILVSTAVQANNNTIFSGVNSNNSISITSTTNSLIWTGLESNLYKINLVRDSILTNPTNPVNNAIYQFIITQNTTGLWSLTYGNMFKFPDGIAPVINANPNSKGILTALYDGTVLLVVSIQNFL